jgi:hypothetical protein
LTGGDERCHPGYSLNRHLPDSPWLWDHVLSFGRLVQRQIALLAGAKRSNRSIDWGEAGEARRFACMKAHLCRRRPVASGLISRSCRRGRRPQPGDQRQDIGKHLPRHRSSSGGEFHPSALTKPDVGLSPHPASTFQPTVGDQSATDTRGSGRTLRAVRANALRRFFDRNRLYFRLAHRARAALMWCSTAMHFVR